MTTRPSLPPVPLSTVLRTGSFGSAQTPNSLRIAFRLLTWLSGHRPLPTLTQHCPQLQEKGRSCRYSRGQLLSPPYPFATIWEVLKETLGRRQVLGGDEGNHGQNAFCFAKR